MDFIIMVKGSANMFICGPEVIQAVTGEKCTMDEIGSAMAHASISGNIHFVADNDTMPSKSPGVFSLFSRPTTCLILLINPRNRLT